jgi:hypothetical protein
MKGPGFHREGVSAMIMMFAARLVRLLTLAASLVLALQIEADAQGQPAPARAPTYEQQQGKINAWTVGLAAGLIEGAPLRLAAEMARVVDDGDNLHVLPIVTRGPTENVNSLLYICGASIWRSSTPTPWRSIGSSSRKSGSTSPTCSVSSHRSCTSSSGPRSRACRTSPARR